MLHIRHSVLVPLFLPSSLLLEPLAAQECQPKYLASSLVGTTSDIQVIGSVETSCRSEAVAIRGRYAYVAAGSCGLQVIDLSSCQPSSGLFRRGDGNDDSSIDIADAIFALGYLFGNGPAPSCLDAADANNDEAIDIADAIAVLSHLFSGSGELPEPFGQCGTDPTGDALGCEGYTPCQR